jgi:hypothetical protein
MHVLKLIRNNKCILLKCLPSLVFQKKFFVKNYKKVAFSGQVCQLVKIKIKV